ncbi:MAG: hypothetical protein ACKOFC_02600 [Solirubrobacterales bacterium]
MAAHEPLVPPGHGHNPRLGRADVGRRALVPSLSYAAAAAGADGVIVEVHPEPEEAVCDGPQALRAGDFAAYAQTLNRAAQLAGKRSFLPEEAPAA